MKNPQFVKILLKRGDFEWDPEQKVNPAQINHKKYNIWYDADTDTFHIV